MLTLNYIEIKCETKILYVTKALKYELQIMESNSVLEIIDGFTLLKQVLIRIKREGLI